MTAPRMTMDEIRETMFAAANRLHLLSHYVAYDGRGRGKEAQKIARALERAAKQLGKP